VNDNDDLHRTTLSYNIVDAYAKLLYLLVKYNGDVPSRINILNKILKAVVTSLKDDFEMRKVRVEEEEDSIMVMIMLQRCS